MQYPRVKLGDVCDFYRGLTYSKSDEVEKSSNVVLRSNNINLENNVLDFTELKYINDEITIPCEKLVKKNTLLMCMANGSKQHLGKVALIDSEYGYAFGGFMGLLIPKNIYPKYLYYSLIAPQFTFLIQHLTDGTNINNLKFSDIKEYEFSLPALPDQQEIVARLEKELAKVDEMAESFKRMAELADEEFQSVLSETFEHVEGKKVKLGDVCQIDRGKSQHRPRNDSRLFGGKYPFIQTGDIRNANGGFITSFEQTYSDFGLAQSKLWNKGTLCITIAANIGETAILDIDACFPDSVVGLVPNAEKLDVEYLNYYFVNIKENLATNAPGTAQKNINIAILKNINIIIPTKAIQINLCEKIKDSIEKRDSLKNMAQRGLSLCSELRKSILQEAFS